MSAPTTAAGRGLLYDLGGAYETRDDIIAIEAEAAAAARTALLDELEAVVGGLPAYDRGDELVLKRDAVLAEINRRRP